MDVDCRGRAGAIRKANSEILTLKSGTEVLFKFLTQNWSADASLKG